MIFVTERRRSEAKAVLPVLKVNPSQKYKRKMGTPGRVDNFRLVVLLLAFEALVDAAMHVSAASQRDASANPSLAAAAVDMDSILRDGGDMERRHLQQDTEDPIVYQVGVLAIRGFESAYKEFNATFSDYLTATAGARLSQQRGRGAVRFELKPLNFNLLFTDVEDRIVGEFFLLVNERGALMHMFACILDRDAMFSHNIRIFFISADFIYVNPSAYSCIESEYGANSLVSQISLRNVGGGQYRLTQFGGVVFARSDNDAIQTISDITNKTVAAASISGLGSGQMQFRLLQRAGMSYINDPIRLVFTSNQGKVVNGVLNGDFDVGFVRTDQLERSKDPNGEPIDLNLVKVIDPIQELKGDDGELFPFDSSTTLYPEWNLGALTFVPNEVSVEVQRAMLDLSRHADIGAELETCYLACGSSGTGVAACQEKCDTELVPLHPELQVETMEVAGDGSQADVAEEDTLFGTPFYSSSSLATLAYRARQNGKYAGWRSTLSYMELRNMQEETGFIQKNSTTGGMACVRASRIYDAVVCPEGHFRKSVQEVEEGCYSDDVGNIGCPDEFQCVCRPCQRAYDVDVFPLVSGKEASGAGSGCAKMEICGTTKQQQTITFRAVDNRKRDGIDYLTVVVSEGDATREIKAIQVEGPEIVADSETEGSGESPRYTYKFDIVSSRVGIMILEIFAGRSQIPESPLRVQVEPRSCADDYGGDSLREADASGNCICTTNSVDIGGRCVALSVLLPAILIPTFFLALIGICLYVDHKKKQADAVWNVKPSELNFDDPPEIVGRGTFGLVLLAEYRGTQVAVKRVIPPKVSKTHKAAVRRGCRSSTGTTGNESRASLEQRKKVDKAFRTGEGAIQKRRSATSSRRGSSSSWNTGSHRSFDMADLSDSDEDDGDNVDLETGLRSGSMAKLRANGSDRGIVSGGMNGAKSNGHAGSASTDPGGTAGTTARTTIYGKVGLKNPFKQDQYSKLKTDFISEMRHLSKCKCDLLLCVYSFHKLALFLTLPRHPTLSLSYLFICNIFIFPRI